MKAFWFVRKYMTVIGLVSIAYISADQLAITSAAFAQTRPTNRDEQFVEYLKNRTLEILKEKRNADAARTPEVSTRTIAATAR